MLGFSLAPHICQYSILVNVFHCCTPEPFILNTTYTWCHLLQTLLLHYLTLSIPGGLPVAISGWFWQKFKCCLL